MPSPVLIRTRAGKGNLGLKFCPFRVKVLGFKGYGFRVWGLHALGFRVYMHYGLGFTGIWVKDLHALGYRVYRV